MNKEQEQEKEQDQIGKLLKKQWFILQVHSGYEDKVKRSIQERVQLAKMDNLFGDIVIPKEEVVEIKNGKKRISQRKFYPGYVLIDMSMTDETWHLIRQISKVSGFVGGTSQKPTPISESEVNKIFNRVADGVDKPQPKVLYRVGEIIRVNDGPFDDFNGIVEKVDFEKNKLLIAVQIFGRSTPVELDFGQVEKT
ncbi:MAG: transcription termination/antitermination protein NusG [Gammaproteobacteria bacterium]|nr:MAG: transcription termination/antitermination protein NusG [Gammaproteobacteria bacterium]